MKKFINCIQPNQFINQFFCIEKSRLMEDFGLALLPSFFPKISNVLSKSRGIAFLLKNEVKTTTKLVYFYF